MKKRKQERGREEERERKRKRKKKRVRKGGKGSKRKEVSERWGEERRKERDKEKTGSQTLQPSGIPLCLRHSRCDDLWVKAFKHLLKCLFIFLILPFKLKGIEERKRESGEKAKI